MRSRLSNEERRAQIIRATAAVMLKKGFTAATTRDVTARIRVGIGLLNHYFQWAELRRLAFERIAEEGNTQTFANADKLGADRVMRRLVKDAFSRFSEPYLRVWIEAIDEAQSDSQLARSVNRCAADFRARLEALLRRGNDEGVWRCADPEGSAWRILAVHDGLVGFVLTGGPSLSRRQAGKHLRTTIDMECGVSALGR